MTNNHQWFIGTLRILFVVTILSILYLCPLPLYAAAVYVGIIEYSPDIERVGTPPEMRVMFRSEGNRWRAMTDEPKTMAELRTKQRKYPHALAWHVIYKGKEYSALASRNTATWNSYAQIGTQEITSDLGAVPKIENQESEFSNWEGIFPYRPLAASTASSAHDPEAWKAAVPTAREISRVIAAFRKQASTFPQCSTEADSPHLSYQDKDVRLLKAYRSSQNAWTIGVRLDPKLNTCPDSPDPLWQEHWFAITTSNQVHFLGAEIHPVDAADFNGDGRSEWVFMISRYNEDGYMIVDSHFEQPVESVWHYH